MDGRPPSDDSLREAAEKFGIQQEFWDIFRRRHITSPGTNRAILTALGFDCSSEETLRQSLAAREAKEQSHLLPPVLVISENEPLQLPEKLRGLDFEVITEQGDRHLNPAFKLPLGYHELRVGSATTRLIVTPDRAWLPANEKMAGLGLMLYGMRSDRNWGCGDFHDLRELIDWAVPALRIGFIALNPLHAIHNRRPYNTSPYLPNSIFYRNFIYLDIEAIPGFDRIRQRFEDGETRAALVFARRSQYVEYETVAALKRRALEMIFDHCPPARDCKTWIAHEGDLLRLYATYSALDEHLHAHDPNLWVWPDWPEEYRDPSSPAVAKFAAEHEREILFHGWVQWQIDRQLAAVQAHALKLGMPIGLYHDLALATDSCGSDLWAHRAFFVAGCRVGSPPDDFSPTGQDWSFPPPNNERHRDDGYRLFTESIRKTLRHGGALRIDHVMRLFRLFWIPPGHDATDGAYVHDSPDDVVRILALESVRNKAVIIGEDLGTVEDRVRETLARVGVLSYRLLYFERNNDVFRAPGEYPAQALVSTTTHDLPTVAGFWTAADIAARLRAGAIDQTAFQSQLSSRAKDKQHLLDALFAANLLPAAYERRADQIPELTGELHYAIMGYLATTPSMLWLVNQEDISKEPDQQNLPGTTAEYPNWSRKIRWSLTDLNTLADAKDCVAMLRHWIDKTGRALPWP
jgi:4-alpha-glucanotransferase